MKRWLALLKESVVAWINDSAPSKGAALAYYATFSITPLLFLAIAVAALFFGEDAVQGAVFAQLADLMGEQGVAAIREMLAHLDRPSRGIWSTVTGLVLLLIGASTVFGQLQAALDTIWQAPPSAAKSSGLWNFIRARLLSFGMVLGMGFLVAVSLLLSTAVSTMGKWWGPHFSEAIGHVLDLGISFGMLTAMFALIYKYIPRVHVAWKDVWVGAAVTAALFTIGKWLIGLYLGKSELAAGFGAFGSLVIVMVWVYYSSQIFLLGAEFTWVYARHFGSRRSQGATVPSMPAFPPAMAPSVPLARAPSRQSATRRHPSVFLAGAFAVGVVLRLAAQKVSLPRGRSLLPKRRFHLLGKPRIFG